jgi:hypothetical protein
MKTLSELLIWSLAITVAVTTRLGDLLTVPAPEAEFVAALAPAQPTLPNLGIEAPDLSSMKTVDLRRLARAQGIKTAGGRKVHLARKADLLTALA